MKTHFQTLYRSPLKTLLTLLLLAAAAFLFLYNLSEYSVSSREYREARDKYEGVLTAEDSVVPENRLPFNEDHFLLADSTNPAETYGQAEYLDTHHESLRRETLEELAALPHISRVERRYMTAGVSPDYLRLDTDKNYFSYDARCILEGTVTLIQPAFMSSTLAFFAPEAGEEGFKAVSIMDWKVLAGDESWLRGEEEQRIEMWILPDETKGSLAKLRMAAGNNLAFLALDPDYFQSDFERLEVGRRYVFVLRNDFSDGHLDGEQEILDSDAGKRSYYVHRFYMADDTRKGWWPYVTDITDLGEDWLEGEDFAPLRELIRVTNDDLHTFDMVYTNDMAAIRRVAQGRMVCDEGRLLTPGDAGQPVCVVNTDVMEAYGLKVGDTLTLDLGNYLCEQYAPLGAVASTKGRYATEFTRQDFTIVGTWRDLNEGKHAQRDLYWCYSNNGIFIPASFLPDCVNADTYEAKPGEVSFVVGNAEELGAFRQEVLPGLEEEGLLYEFSDGGWSLIAEDLMQARSLALVKLLIFSAAALLALVLTVWLFIGRKKREYGILRALGMKQREAGARLYVPFLLLGFLAAVFGFLASRLVTARQLAAAAEASAHTPASPGLFLLGALGFLALLALIALLGLGLIRRKSVLELVQDRPK